MFEQVAGRSNIMRRCLVEKGCIRKEVRFCLQCLLHRFTIFGRSYYRNFGSWIVGSRACRVKHNLTWTVFIS
jgi:hypothetical protein